MAVLRLKLSPQQPGGALLIFMKEPVKIPLTQGKFALVDAVDAPEILKHKWCAQRTSLKLGGVVWYAIRGGRTPEGRHTTVYMHKQIAGPGKVDHANRDGLDNRRCNLRPATHGQNVMNSEMKKPTSGYRGVERLVRSYRARISKAGRRYPLGLFATAEEAARAWDVAAVRLWGEFAKLNFPTTGTNQERKDSSYAIDNTK